MEETPSITTQTTSPPSPASSGNGPQDAKVSKPDSGQPSPTQGGSKAQPEMFEIKVNGRMVKMTRQELIDSASMSHAAQSRFEEAAQIRKQVDKIVSTAKNNPIEALMDPALGLSRDQIRDAFEKWYSREFIEPETLTAEQRKLKEYETKLQRYEEEEKQKKLKEDQDAQEKLTHQQKEFLQNQIVEALESSGLPKTKFIASRMAFYMRQNLMNGWDAPISLIVKQVKNERQDIMGDLVHSSDGQTLIDLLGNDVVNKIRQHDLKQLRERRQGVPATPGDTRSTPPSRSDKISSSEVTRRLREMRLGKK